MVNNLTRVLLLFTLLCPATAAQTNPQASPPSWRTFTSESGKFSVEMPGLPEYRVVRREKPGRPLTFPFYYLLTSSELYAVSYLDVPASGKSVDERLEDGLSNMVRGFTREGGKEISRRKFISSLGCPGLIWVGSTTKIPVLEVRAIGTPERAYALFHGSSNTGQAARDAAARFFDSFKVVGSTCDGEKPK